MTYVQNMPPSYAGPAHPAPPNTSVDPYAVDAQYTYLLPNEMERLYARTEETSLPMMDTLPPLTPIHVDEAKLYRTTHRSSTIPYHLPSNTRHLQRRREKDEDLWDSLS